MEHNRGLPYLFGGFMAVIAGLTSFLGGAENHTIYVRMALSMVVFYLLGTIFRNMVGNIKKEININEEQKRIAALEEERREHAAREQQNQPGHTLNLTADDNNDDFSPMTVSRVIASKMKE